MSENRNRLVEDQLRQVWRGHGLTDAMTIRVVARVLDELADRIEARERKDAAA